MVPLPDGVAVTVTVLTEHHRLVQELARSNAELEGFAYAISHDLRAPLRIISGFAEALQDRDLDPKASEFVATIVRSGKRMSQMVHDLLDYARVGQGCAAEEADAGNALRRAVENLEADIIATGAEITHSDLPRVRVPWQRLTQVFQNLLENALRFRTPKVPPIVRIETAREGGMVTFSIRDNGVGIAPRHQPRLFDLFMQIPTDDAPPGVGMGLALCKRIIERHGGRIWVQSTPPEGATFSFDLPAAGDD